jgi:MFS family permease
MTAREATPAEQPASAKEIRAVFIGLMIVLGLGAIDQSIVATALPRIASDLGGVSRLTWIVTSYVLASTGVIPLSSLSWWARRCAARRAA